jgi:hypothetical protein
MCVVRVYFASKPAANATKQQNIPKKNLSLSVIF